MRPSQCCRFLLAGIVAVVAVGCRREPPSPPYNYNLAGPGEPPLMPTVLPPQDPDARGSARRAQGPEPSAPAGAPAERGQPTAAPGSQEGFPPIARFNEFITAGEYEQIPSLVVPEQRERCLSYWQVFAEMALAFNDAVTKATEVAGATQPDLVPRIEELNARIEGVTKRTLVPRSVRQRDDQAAINIDPPTYRCVTAIEGPELWLRLVDGEWLIMVPQLPDEAGVEKWVESVEEVTEGIDEAVERFDEAGINLDELIRRLNEFVDRVTAAPAAGAAESAQPAEATQPSAEQPPAEQPPEAQPPQEQPTEPAASQPEEPPAPPRAGPREDIS